MADLHSKYTCRLVYIIQCTCSHESTVSVSGRLRDVVQYNEQNSRSIAAAGRPAHFTRMPISDPNCVKLDHYNATLDRDKRRCSVKWMIEHMFPICFYRCMYVKFTIPNIINMIVVFSESFAREGRVPIWTPCLRSAPSHIRIRTSLHCSFKLQVFQLVNPLNNYSS